MKRRNSSTHPITSDTRVDRVQEQGVATTIIISSQNVIRDEIPEKVFPLDLFVVDRFPLIPPISPTNGRSGIDKGLSTIMNRRVIFEPRLSELGPLVVPDQDWVSDVQVFGNGLTVYFSEGVGGIPNIGERTSIDGSAEMSGKPFNEFIINRLSFGVATGPEREEIVRYDDRLSHRQISSYPHAFHKPNSIRDDSPLATPHTPQTDPHTKPSQTSQTTRHSESRTRPYRAHSP
jgi:hypothetical protein